MFLQMSSFFLLNCLTSSKCLSCLFINTCKGLYVVLQVSYYNQDEVVIIMKLQYKVMTTAKNDNTLLKVTSKPKCLTCRVSL